MNTNAPTFAPTFADIGFSLIVAILVARAVPEPMYLYIGTAVYCTLMFISYQVNKITAVLRKR